MREGWPATTIGEYCTITSGGTPSKQDERFWSGDIPWVSAKDLKSDRISEAALHISQGACEQSATKIAPVGSLLVLVRGMGLANGVPIGEVTVPVAFNQDIRAIHPPHNVLPRFLLLALRNSLMHGVEESVLSSAAHGTLKIDADALRQITFPVPPLSEQQHIVAILDEAFAGIATAKANAEKNLQNARELFDSDLALLFGHRRDGWLETTLGGCVRFIDYRGRTPTKTESGLRLITAKNVKMGFLQEAPMEYVDPATYISWMTRGIPSRGDVLFTTEAPLGNVAQLDTDDKVVFAQRVIIMQPALDVLDKTFLKYLLLSAPVQRRIHEKATGATALGIKASLLRTIRIQFPAEISEQHRLVAHLDQMNAESLGLQQVYRKKLAALDELKQSLLAKAFAGELT